MLKAKESKKIYYANTNQKKAGMVLSILNEVDVRARDK